MLRIACLGMLGWNINTIMLGPKITKKFSTFLFAGNLSSLVVLSSCQQQIMLGSIYYYDTFIRTDEAQEAQ
jgi:hypothetical protein